MVPTRNIANGLENQITNLASNLEVLVLTKFDDLVSKGEIHWAPYTSELFEENGFKAVFQLCPHLRKKPMQAADAPERKTGQGANPFLNPDPTFVVSQVGSEHTLLLNKYCVYRPSLILHTREFVPQSADLDRGDIVAVWAVLRAPAKRPLMMIYNCGIDSGSSQGHKHMQLWHYPSIEEIGFDLFPSQATSTSAITTNISGVPHRHFVLRLPQNADHDVVYSAYERLLVKIRQCHEKLGSTAYNIVLTQDWLCLIPRRSNGVDRGAGSNAAGVLGLIWTSRDSEKEIWTDPTLSDYLVHLGLPNGTEI